MKNMNMLISLFLCAVALLLLLACRQANASTVIGLLNLDGLADTLTYGAPDESGNVSIEIVLATADGKTERIARKYAASQPHIAVSAKRAGEIRILEGGDTGGSIKYYRTFSYNQRVKDWFLTKEITIHGQMSGEGYAPPKIEIVYHDGEVGLGGATIDKSKAETEAARDRSARLSKDLTALHDGLMGMYKDHKLATMPESTYDMGALAEMIDNVPVTEQIVETYNNIGFFLGENDEGVYGAVFVLDKVITAIPDRAVAYLNIADAYFKIQSLPQAKTAYAKYADLMKRQGTQKKIPQRALDRVK